MCCGTGVLRLRADTGGQSRVRGTGYGQNAMSVFCGPLLPNVLEKEYSVEYLRHQLSDAVKQFEQRRMLREADGKGETIEYYPIKEY